MTNLSEAARNALLSTDSHRQGAVPMTSDEGALAELRTVGLTGSGGGLTRKGTIVRERLVNARLEAAFG